MRGEQRSLPGFVPADRHGQHPQLFDQHLHSQHRWLDDGWVGGQRRGGGDQVQSFLDHVGAPAVVGVVEAAHGLGAGALQRRQARPLGEKLQRQRTVDIFAHQLQGLPVIAFERGDQPATQARAQVHRLAARFAQRGQLARRRRVRLPRTKLVAVFGQQVGQ